jgi:hypothetical protein
MQKDTMADWALFIGVPFGNLQPLKGFKLAEDVAEEFVSTTEDLVAKGCDGNALMTALCMANTVEVHTIPSCYKSEGDSQEDAGPSNGHIRTGKN